MIEDKIDRKDSEFAPSVGSDVVAGVSIIIPALNEAENIDPLFKRIFKTKLPDELDCEVIVIDADSSDNTREKVLDWAGAYPVKLIRREQNGSLASAVMFGAREAIFETVVVMDADLSHSPEIIPELLQPILDGECDVVIGSRYIDGGAAPDWPFKRKAASRFAVVPAHLFTDVNDPMSGFFATSRRRLCSLRPDIPGFKIGLELLAAGGDDLRVREIPIVFHDRFKGFSKMNKRVVNDYFTQVFQLAGVHTETFSKSRLAMLGTLGVLIDFLFFIVAGRAGYESIVAHISGITVSCTLLSFAIFQFWRGTEPTRLLRWPHIFGIIIGLITSISIQGAVYMFFVQYTSLDTILSFLPAATSGNVWFILVITIFVFSDYSRLNQGTKQRMAAAGCILFAGLFRVLYLGLPELIEQEAYYWNFSQHLDFCYIDYPPMVAFLIRLGTTLGGMSELGVRLMAPVCWLVTACYSYCLTRRIFGHSAAIGAILLLSFLPFYFGTAMIMTPDAPLLACWSALLYYLYRTLVEGRSDWGVIGIFLGCGIISDYSTFLICLPFFCFVLLDKKARRVLGSWGPYRSVLIALLIFVPILVWNIQNEWVSLVYLIEHWLTGRATFDTFTLTGFILLILTPAGFISVAYFITCGKRFFLKNRTSTVLMGGKHLERSYFFLFLMMLMPLIVSVGFSIVKDVKLNWTSPYWLAVIPFLGCTVMAVRGHYQSGILKVVHWLWRPTILVLLILYVFFLHHVTFGIPGLTFPSKPFLMGWEKFAGELETMVEMAEKETGTRPVVVGMNPYQISSGLAFYRAKNGAAFSDDYMYRAVDETIGWHVFGWNSRMYSYWSSPEELIGKDILVVASGKVRAEYPYFQKHVKRMGHIKELIVSKSDKKIRSFYVRQVYDYSVSGK